MPDFLIVVCRFDRGHVYVNEILQLGARLSITERSFVQVFYIIIVSIISSL